MPIYLSQVSSSYIHSHSVRFNSRPRSFSCCLLNPVVAHTHDGYLHPRSWPILQSHRVKNCSLIIFVWALEICTLSHSLCLGSEACRPSLVASSYFIIRITLRSGEMLIQDYYRTWRCLSGGFLYIFSMMVHVIHWTFHLFKALLTIVIVVFGSICNKGSIEFK